MTDIKIINDDVIHWAENYSGEKAMAIFCDPPYHLISTNKRFSAPNSAPAQFGKDGAFQRASTGFMGQSWDGLSEDGQGIAFKPATWAALGQHLYAGAWGFAFASSRGWHRLAVAIEDAGHIIQPAIWIYGYSTGFPKSTRIDLQQDRRNGINHLSGQLMSQNTSLSGGNNSRLTKEPVLESSKTWQNHRYGGQILAPSVEPIICFQKPYNGRPLDCIVETGAGALNVEAGRIGATHPGRETIDNGNGLFGLGGGKIGSNVEGGRWPKNLVISHLPTCTRINGEWQCPPECVVRQMGEEYGESKSTIHPIMHIQARMNLSKGNEKEQLEFNVGHNDSGPITRFFFQPHFSYEVYEQLATGKQVVYVAKPGLAEREAGLNGHARTIRNRVNSGGLENDPRFAPSLKANNHPTLKSIEANRYLCSLLLPPPEYAPRRILIPFAGSGSECIGAMLAGWDEIIGIEQSEAYCDIARARVAWWQSKMDETGGDIEKIIDVWQKEESSREIGQLNLF